MRRFLVTASVVPSSRSRKLRLTTVGDPPRWPRDTQLSTKVGIKFRRQVAVAQSVQFARGLRATEFVRSFVVPSSTILVTLMKEAPSCSQTRLLQEPHGVTSQKTAFFLLHIRKEKIWWWQMFHAETFKIVNQVSLAWNEIESSPVDRWRMWSSP
jgi:hypothetical protein